MTKQSTAKDKSFMDWLAEVVDTSPEASQAARDEGIRLNLSYALREARRAAGMTQAMVSEASGLRQSLVSRLEKAGYNPTIETLARYVEAVGAELVLSVVISGRSFAATDASERTVLLPADVVKDAFDRGIDLREHVLHALYRQLTIREVADEMRAKLDEMRGWIQDMNSRDPEIVDTHGYQIGVLTDSDDNVQAFRYAAAA